MGTTIRAEVSKKNRYWIDKHRYYELKHFCLQYPTWRKAYMTIDGLSGWTTDWSEFYSKLGIPADPTAKIVELKSLYFERMRLVEQSVIAADPELANYLLKGVTEGLSYEKLKLKLNIPCSKDTYYDRYRRFFWLLHKTRS